MEQSRRRRFFPAGAVKGGVEVGDLDALHLGVKIHTILRNQNRLVAGGSGNQKLFG